MKLLATMALPNGQEGRTTVKQYDPIKVVEGMFNGSMLCIAHALKGNRDSIAQTKTVLAECSKKFQDSLDDCEIQILDAKWYLEQRLVANRAQRAADAKAKESSPANSNKRKVEGDENALQPTSPKRAKSHEASSPIAMNVTNDETIKDEEEPAEQLQRETEDSIERDEKQDTSDSKDDPKKEEEKPEITETAAGDAEGPKDDADDALKGSEQATPAMTDNDYIFESMFGEPTDTNDVNNENENNEEDVNMDFDFEEQFNIPDAEEKETEPQKESEPDKTQSQEMSRSQNASQNLTSLLPGGLDAFSGQANGSNGMDFTMDGTNNLSGTADDNQNEPNMFTDDFGPNIFDQAFEDGAFDSMDVGNIDDPGQSDVNFDDFFT